MLSFFIESQIRENFESTSQSAEDRSVFVQGKLLFPITDAFIPPFVWILLLRGESLEKFFLSNKSQNNIQKKPRKIPKRSWKKISKSFNLVHFFCSGFLLRVLLFDKVKIFHLYYFYSLFITICNFTVAVSSLGRSQVGWPEIDCRPSHEYHLLPNEGKPTIILIWICSHIYIYNGIGQADMSNYKLI